MRPIHHVGHRQTQVPGQGRRRNITVYFGRQMLRSSSSQREILTLLHAAPRRVKSYFDSWKVPSAPNHQPLDTCTLLQTLRRARRHKTNRSIRQKEQTIFFSLSSKQVTELHERPTKVLPDSTCLSLCYYLPLRAGIETRMFYSVQRDEVYCKIRCPLERLQREAVSLVATLSAKLTCSVL